MDKRGFSYLELIFVIAIMATLATMALFIFKSVLVSARDTKRIQIMRDTQFAMELYHLRNRNYGDSLSDFCLLMDELVNRSYLIYEPVDPRTKVNVCGIGNPSVGGAMYVYEATPSSGIATSFLLKLVRESGGVLTWTSI